jgi:hypothetical protein
VYTFSKLDFSKSRTIVLHESTCLGLNILLEAWSCGDVTLTIYTANNILLKTKDYHYSEWERLGTEGIIAYWVEQIETGDFWF